MFPVTCQLWLVATSPENFGRCLEVQQSTLSGECGVAWYVWVTTRPLAWHGELKWVTVYPGGGRCDLLCAINVS